MRATLGQCAAGWSLWSSGWPEGDNGDVKAEYTNGEYRLLVRKANYGLVTRPGFRGTDYSVLVDLRNSTNKFSSYAIVFGAASDWITFYSLEIYPDGWYGIYRFDPSSYAILAEAQHPAIKTGTAINHLSSNVLATRERIQFVT